MLGFLRQSCSYRPSLLLHKFASVKRFYSLYAAKKQVYAIPTYDAAFKWVLNSDEVRPSFFHAFIPNMEIQTSTRLDDHMNPLGELQLVRNFLHDKKTLKTAARLSSALHQYVVQDKTRGVEDDDATGFLTDMMKRFYDIQRSFPQSRYNGTMDFACQLKNGEFALVEMQVIAEDYWVRTLECITLFILCLEKIAPMHVYDRTVVPLLTYPPFMEIS